METYDEQATCQPSGGHITDEQHGERAGFDLDIFMGQSNSSEDDLDGDGYTCDSVSAE
jgi:hypothetical protein